MIVESDRLSLSASPGMENHMAFVPQNLRCFGVKESGFVILVACMGVLVLGWGKFCIWSIP